MLPQRSLRISTPHITTELQQGLTDTSILHAPEEGRKEGWKRGSWGRQREHSLPMVVDDLPARKLVALLQEGGGGKWQQRTSPPQSTGRWRKSFSLLPRTISCSVEGGLREVVGVVMGGMVRYGGWCGKKGGKEGVHRTCGWTQCGTYAHIPLLVCWG